MRTHPPRARAYMRVKRSPLRTLGPLCTPVCPFGIARPVRRARAATATTKRRGSLWWRRKRKREREGEWRERESARRRCATRVYRPYCCTPANRRQISPGRLDACLRCLSSVPINIKPHSTNEAGPPAPGHPSTAARCVHRYRGAGARRILGVPAARSPLRRRVDLFPPLPEKLGDDDRRLQLSARTA